MVVASRIPMLATLLVPALASLVYVLLLWR